jgi:hypothetical protein
MMFQTRFTLERSLCADSKAFTLKFLGDLNVMPTKQLSPYTDPAFISHLQLLMQHSISLPIGRSLAYSTSILKSTKMCS